MIRDNEVNDLCRHLSARWGVIWGSTVSALFLVLIAVSGALVAEPRQTQAPPPKTSDNNSWRRYVSSKYGYELEYPSTGKLDDSHPAHVKIILRLPFDGGGGKIRYDVSSFDILVQAQPANLDVKKWADKKWDPSAVLESKEVQVAGRSAYRFKIFEYDSNSYHFYLAAKSNLFDLYYVDPQSQAELAADVRQHYGEIFDKMVQSFSFAVSASDEAGNHTARQ